MSAVKRVDKFREAIWLFVAKTLPKMPVELQPSLADMAWLMANHFFSPEVSQKLYLRLQKIWLNRSLESNNQVELLAYCAWKLQLYLTFNQPEIAFSLFQEIIKVIRYNDHKLETNLELCCIPNSKKFPLPRIPEEDMKFLFGISQACQQSQSNLTINYLANKMACSQKDLIWYLNKIKMVIGSLVAFEALGLYMLRVEIEISSNQNWPQLLERIKPIIYRCEAHTSPSKTPKENDLYPTQLSMEFLYPISQEKPLFKWAARNKIRVLRKVEQYLYQNFNVLYKDQWDPLGTTRLKSKGSRTSIIITSNKLEVNKRLLRITETYLKPAAFLGNRKAETADCLLPFHRLGSYLKMREKWAHKTAAELFQKRILVPFLYSELLRFDPEFILEGEELTLQDKAKSYLYTRGEMLQPFNVEKQAWNQHQKVFRLYVPKVSVSDFEEFEVRSLKRLYWASPRPLIQVNMYDFKKSSWKCPKLPDLHDFQ